MADAEGTGAGAEDGAEDGAGAGAVGAGAGAAAGAAAGFGGGAESPVTFFPNPIALKTPLLQKRPYLILYSRQQVQTLAPHLVLAEQSQNTPHSTV